MASTNELKVEKIFSVKDYVCVVTGGGTGIGLMATQALAANGAKVYITGRRVEVLENAAKSHDPQGGGQIIPVGPCDVTSKYDLEKLTAEISKKEKHIDPLITNAGISGKKTATQETGATELRNKLWRTEDFDSWSKVFNTNVSSVYFTTVAFLPLLQAGTSTRSRLSASVIVISSMSGIMTESQGHLSYNAAKGATVHLSKMMSVEFMKTGIRVNSIAPGYFPSEMTMGESDENQKSRMPNQEVRDKRHVPMERAGSGLEMAQAVIFLAKNTCVNGEVVVVDGGVLNQVPSG